MSKLTLTTPSDTEIVLTRVFDAPRDLVFEAHTSCEHMRNWWGPARYEFSACDIDFRVGGAWRIAIRDEDGTEHASRGEYTEIVRPERIGWTFEYEGMPGHVSQETLELTEQDGKTTLVATAVYASVEARDATLEVGMEAGVTETWDRLEGYLASMQAQSKQ